MAKKWDYSELSKAAKLAGGPEKFVEMIENAGKEAGKIEMLPWVGATAVISSLSTVAVIKIINRLNSRKKHDKAELEKVKEEIIKGIEEYDANHVGTEEEN